MSTPINRREAEAIYSAWQSQVKGNEKAAIKRLLPEERADLSTIISFLKNPSAPSQIILKGHATLLHTLGFSDISTVLSPEEKKIIEAEKKAAVEFFKKTLDKIPLPKNFADYEKREKLFDKILEAAKKEVPELEELENAIVFSLKRTFIYTKANATNVNDEKYLEFLDTRLNSIMKDNKTAGHGVEDLKDRPKDLEKQRALNKTNSLLTRILGQEARLNKAVNDAELYLKKGQLIGAFQKIIENDFATSPHMEHESRFGSLIWNIQHLDQSKDVNLTAANLTETERALLSTNWAKEKLISLLTDDKANPKESVEDALFQVTEKFRKSVNTVQQQEWIDKNALQSAGPFTFVLKNKLIREIFKVFRPDIDTIPTEQTLPDFVHALREKIADAKKVQEQLGARLGGDQAIDLNDERKFEKDLSAYLNDYEFTFSTFSEAERRLSQNLKSPFYQGLYAQLLHDKAFFTMRHEAFLSSWNELYNPEYVLPNGKTIEQNQKEGVSFSKIFSSMKESFMSPSDATLKQLELAKFWAEASAKQDSFEGKLVLAKLASNLPVGHLLGILRANEDSNYDTQLAKVNAAIRSAENRNLYRFSGFAPFLRFLGYRDVGGKRVTEAKQLKLEICKDAYKKKVENANKFAVIKQDELGAFELEKADYYMDQMLKIAEQLDQPSRPTRLKEMTSEIKAAFSMQGEELVGWLFGNDSEELDLQDQNMKNLRNLFLEGFKPAVNKIYSVLKSRIEKGKSLSNSDLQQLMLLYMTREEMRNSIDHDLNLLGTRLPEGEREVLENRREAVRRILGGVPSAEDLSDLYPALKLASVYYGKMDNKSLSADFEGYLEQAKNNISYQQAMQKGDFKRALEQYLEVYTFDESKADSEILLNLIHKNENLISSLKQDDKNSVIASMNRAKRLFVDLVGKKESWTKGELRELSALTLEGDARAKDLLRRKSHDYPFAARFASNPLLAIAEAPLEGTNLDLTGYDMRELLLETRENLMNQGGFVVTSQRLWDMNSEVKALSAATDLGPYQNSLGKLLFIAYQAIRDKNEVLKSTATLLLKEYVTHNSLNQEEKQELLRFEKLGEVDVGVNAN